MHFRARLYALLVNLHRLMVNAMRVTKYISHVQPRPVTGMIARHADKRAAAFMKLLDPKYPMTTVIVAPGTLYSAQPHHTKTDLQLQNANRGCKVPVLVYSSGQMAVVKGWRICGQKLRSRQ